MKFAIAVVVLTTVVGVYSDDLIPGVSTVGNGVSERNPSPDVPDEAKQILGKSLKGGDKNSFNIRDLTPADQSRLYGVLDRSVGPYASQYIVRTLATVTDGPSTKIPPNQIIKLAGLTAN